MSRSLYEHPVTTCLDATMAVWLASEARRQAVTQSAMVRSLILAAMQATEPPDQPRRLPRHRRHHTRERA